MIVVHKYNDHLSCYVFRLEDAVAYIATRDTNNI